MKKDKEQSLTRSDSMVIELTPTLRRWFDEATEIYDQALYFLRQDYFGQQKLREEAIKAGKEYKCVYKSFTGDESLYKLVKGKMGDRLTVPSHLFNNVVSSQGIGSNWKSFLKAIADYWKHPSKYKGKPKIPNYLVDRKRGRVRKYAPISFYKGGGDFTRLDGSTRTVTVGKITQEGNSLTLKVPEKVDFATFRCLKLVRYYDRVKVHFIYGRELPERHPYGENVLGIDLGLENIAAMTVNGKDVEGSWVAKGGTIRSINRFYNERLAQCKTVLAHTGGGRTSKRIERLHRKRMQKLDYEMHCLSKRIIQLCAEKGVGTIVVGHNKGWKQKSNLGRKTNQRFVQVPFNDLIWKLRYKAEEVGIDLIETEESYTSKADHLANEEMKRHEDGYAGDRKMRGTFMSSTGRRLNADVNGAIGMLRKAELLTDADLGRMASRRDIEYPSRLQYRERQGAILGIGRGRHGTWHGSEAAKAFLAKDLAAESEPSA